jgi:hypothetical protein
MRLALVLMLGPNLMDGIALVYTPGEATRHCDIVESGVR